MLQRDQSPNDREPKLPNEPAPKLPPVIQKLPPKWPPPILTSGKWPPPTPYVSLAVSPGTFTLQGYHTGGDTDFDGHGPQFDVKCQLKREANILTVVIDATWREIVSDYTTFQGHLQQQIFNASQVSENAKIVSVNDQLVADGVISTEFSTVLNGYGIHTFNSQGLVGQYQIHGDEDGGIFGGDDAPWVTVTLNTIQVVLA